jgi:metal-dependent amidase/aminoacylase/carboxypeptidase family protein
VADGTAARIRTVAAANGLDAAVREVEPFPATANDPVAVAVAAAAAATLGLPVIRRDAPFPWSEDFGHFTAAAPGALIGLGAGERCPALHRPDYDFPDELLPIGIDLWERVVRRAATED